MVRNYVTGGGDPDRVIAALEQAGLLGMGGAGGRAYLKWGDVMRAKGTTGEKVHRLQRRRKRTRHVQGSRDLAGSTPPDDRRDDRRRAGRRRDARLDLHSPRVSRTDRQVPRGDRTRESGSAPAGRTSSAAVVRSSWRCFPSPGGYICGEQTALIEAMEDKRAEPRNRPPELMTNGLYDQPTLLSNVETFAWAPAILQDGGEWFASQGVKAGPLTAGSSETMKGKRLFSISGDLNRPGVYEVPTGITLGELIDKHCGGMKDGKAIAAVALSGPSGGLLPAKIPVSA